MSDHSITAVAGKGLKLSANAQLLAPHCCPLACSLLTDFEFVKRVKQGKTQAKQYKSPQI